MILGEMLAAQEQFKSDNHAEEEGATVDGYVILDNDRVYFNALKNYLIGKYDTAFVGFEYYKNLEPQTATSYFYSAKIKDRYNYWDQTLADVKRAVNLAPQNKWYNAFYAGVLAFSEDYLAAANVMMQLGKKNPEDKREAYISASRLFTKAKKNDSAIAVLDTLLKSAGEDDEELLMEKLKVYLVSGNIKEAIQVTHTLQHYNPLSPEYWIQLVELQLLNKEPSVALSTAIALEAKFKGNEDVASYLFGFYLKQRNIKKVKEQLTMYVQLAQENEDIESRMANNIAQYIINNRSDTAVLDYLSTTMEEVVGTSNSSLAAQRLLATLYLYGKSPEKGMTLFKNLLKLHLKDFELWNIVTSNYLAFDSRDSASIYLDSMATLFPDSALVLVQKMMMAAEVKDFENAINVGFSAIDLAQKAKNVEQEVLVYNAVALYYNDLKKFKESDSIYDKVLEKRPDDLMALNNYAYFLSERKERLDFALNLSKKTIELEDRNPNNLDTYGWILYQMKRYEEAKVYILQAVTLAGDDVSPVVLEHFADVEYRLGNIESAVKIWNIVLKYGGGSADLSNKIKNKRIDDEEME